MIFIMKELIYLLMSLSLVAFVSCSDDDKENASSNGTENGHEWVDLGLTSGTRWATANVGASKPQDYGNYYAWGEVTTKENTIGAPILTATWLMKPTAEPTRTLSMV